ncbi:MAG: ferrochelatase, partial [Actinobacteria bacterium]|nr:ferrochelatase [Actinomycetota bacterium]
MKQPVGVLVMAYGTPASAEDVEAYYTHIRRGRAPTAEQLADLQRRYDAIGGVSPLRARTQSQADAIQAALGDDYVIALGQKHAAPYIEDGVASLVDAGVARIVGLVLAPHYSALSVGE